MKKAWKKTGARAAALALGASILLPSVSAFAATTYTATDDDTFWKLSKRFHVPLDKLMNANPNVDPLNIYAGLKLTIPSGTQANAKTRVAAAESRTVTTASGKTLAYSKVLNMTATAYSSDPRENGWGAVDYFGNPLKLGTIAVDPKVIPFGTKVYITGYDFNGLPKGGMIATASDAGSAIVGNRVDIFIPGSMDYVNQFGIQNVKLYILE